MQDRPPGSGDNQSPTTKTQVETTEKLADGTKIVYEIKYTEPGSPEDQRLADEQIKAVFALLKDVAERRSRRRSIASPAMDPIATTKSPTPPEAS
jgi:hypothetical protein